MPRGRKKSQSSGAPALRMVRECSEESSIAEDAPKIKDSRLEMSPPVLHSAANGHHHHNKITDYFSPSSSNRSRSPPVLLPQVSSLPSKMGEADGASDRSEGDSGKENEEDLADDAMMTMAKYNKGGSGARPKSNGVVSSSSNAAVAGRSKLAEKTVQDQGRVVTRSRSSPSGSTARMPLFSSLSSAYSCLSPAEAVVTPPPSPSKSGGANGITSPTSPPTPHKIKLLGSGGEKSPAVSALQKLKLSFTPKSSRSSTATSPTRAAAAAAAAASAASTTPKGPKKSKQPSLASTKTINNTASVGGGGTKQDKLTRAAAGSHKVTEYFPIRRSGRRPKTALEKEHLADIEHHLVSGADDHLDIVVEDFGEKGRGVVATRDYVRGEFVVEYAGDLIDVGVAKERESKYSLDLSTGCYMYYFKHQGKQYCIDATRESGRVGRLVNHSRQNPNLQTKVVTFADTPRLILVARRDIESGTEFLYDYGDRSKESLKAHPWLAL